MKRFLILLTALMLSATTALAVPNTMNYQGQLFLNGSPTTGPVSIVFRMYDAETGGTLLWTETDNVTVTGGLFQTTLGDGTAFLPTLFTAQISWLEMEVNGQVLTPRTQFKSVPYAFQAQRADTANVALSGTGGNELWSTDGTNVWRASGNVGIGTQNPSVKLDVAGSARIANEVGIGADPIGGVPLRVAGFVRVDGGPAGSIRMMSNGSFGVVETIDNTPVALQPSGGNVGIGTSSPGSRFHVMSSSTAAEFQETAAQALIRFRDQATVNAPHIGSSGDDFVILTGPSSSEKLRVLNSGYLSLTSSLSFSLERFIATNTVNPPHIGASGDNFIILAGPSTSEMLRVTSDGDVGIGTPNPTSKLHVIGDFCATGTKNRLVHDDEYGDLYYHATESAHALFTIEGEGRMTDGAAHVQLDPKWLAGVTIDEEHPMQVWITFYGPHGNYYVERATSHNGFKVIDPSGSNAAFGWKVEARQKGYADLYLNRPEPTATK